VRRITITVTESSSESQMTFCASPLMSTEPSKGRVAGLAVLVRTGDDWRISLSIPVANLWEGLFASSSFLSWQSVEVSSGPGHQEGRDSLSGAGVQFEMLLEVREEVGSQ